MRRRRPGSALEYGIKGVSPPPPHATFRKRVPAGLQLGAHLQMLRLVDVEHGKKAGCYAVTLLRGMTRLDREPRRLPRPAVRRCHRDVFATAEGRNSCAGLWVGGHRFGREGRDDDVEFLKRLEVLRVEGVKNEWTRTLVSISARSVVVAMNLVSSQVAVDPALAHGKFDVAFAALFLLCRQLPAEKLRLFSKGTGRLLRQIAHVDALHVYHLLFLERLPLSPGGRRAYH